MGESLEDVLLKGADVLSWLGKNKLASACYLFARFVKVKNIGTLSALEDYVIKEENMQL